MAQVASFMSTKGKYDLDDQVNDFIKDKEVINVSLSVVLVGYTCNYYAMVAYKG